MQACATLPQTAFLHSAAQMMASRRSSWAACHSNAAPPAAYEPSREVVFVWDLDETLILFHSLLNGDFARARGGGAAAASDLECNAAMLGKEWQETILAFCDEHLHYNDLEGYEFTHRLSACPSTGAVVALPEPPPSMPPTPEAEPPHRAKRSRGPSSLPWAAPTPSPPPAQAVVSLVHQSPAAFGAALVPQSPSASDDADPCTPLQHCGFWTPQRQPLHSADQLATMFAQVDAVYAGGHAALPLDPIARRLLHGLWAATEQLGGGWLTHAQRLLQRLHDLATASASGCSVRHVLVTGGQLVETCGKLLLFGLDRWFPLESIHSASGVTKHHCFRRIAASAAPGARFVAVGDGHEEEEAAAMLGWPFVRTALAPAAAGAAGAAGAGCDSAKRRRAAEPCDALGSTGQPLTQISAQQLWSVALAQCDAAAQHGAASPRVPSPPPPPPPPRL